MCAGQSMLTFYGVLCNMCVGVLTFLEHEKRIISHLNASFLYVFLLKDFRKLIIMLLRWVFSIDDDFFAVLKAFFFLFSLKEVLLIPNALLTSFD